MLNVGPAELMVILLAALLILGPKKLPEAARQVGKALSEFRRMSAGLQDEVRSVLDAPTHGLSTPPADPPRAEPRTPADTELPVPPDGPSFT